MTFGFSLHFRFPKNRVTCATAFVRGYPELGLPKLRVGSESHRKASSLTLG
jgi:hypothetical protein